MKITQQEKQFKLKNCSILFTKNNFQLNVERTPGLLWFCFTLLCDWFRKLAPLSKPIRCKLKLITTWSPTFSRALGNLDVFTLRAHRLSKIFSFLLFACCSYFVCFFFTKLNCKALYIWKLHHRLTRDRGPVEVKRTQWRDDEYTKRSHMRRAWRSTTNKRLKLSDAEIVISSKSKHYKGPK